MKNPVVKRTISILLIAFSLFLIMLFVPSFDVVAEIITFELDQKNSIKPLQEGFISENDYQDPSITVHIEEGVFNGTKYHTATIKVANASQIRSAFSSSYKSGSREKGSRIAKNVNAVFAVNGDFCSGSNDPVEHFTVRQGKTYQSRCYGRYDVLAIDENGDFHIIPEAYSKDVQSDVLDYTIINSFAFGPTLILNGERVGTYFGNNYGPNNRTQRCCICQLDTLTYMVICCEGPDDADSTGMTIYEFDDLVNSFEGIQTAYCMDGGASATMYFNGKKINSTKEREICDILYFASAYIPDAD